MSAHRGDYDAWRDITQAVNEAVPHEEWCHWDCPGHRSCGCGADDSAEAVRLLRSLRDAVAS